MIVQNAILRRETKKKKKKNPIMLKNISACIFSPGVPRSIVNFNLNIVTSCEFNWTNVTADSRSVLLRFASRKSIENYLYH